MLEGGEGKVTAAAALLGRARCALGEGACGPRPSIGGAQYPVAADAELRVRFREHINCLYSFNIRYFLF